jgi:hypothetical protein
MDNLETPAPIEGTPGDAGAITETPVTPPQETLLAGKYKDVGNLEEGYKNLESLHGKTVSELAELKKQNEMILTAMASQGSKQQPDTRVTLEQQMASEIAELSTFYEDEEGFESQNAKSKATREVKDKYALQSRIDQLERTLQGFTPLVAGNVFTRDADSFLKENKIPGVTTEELSAALKDYPVNDWQNSQPEVRNQILGIAAKSILGEKVISGSYQFTSVPPANGATSPPPLGGMTSAPTTEYVSTFNTLKELNPKLSETDIKQMTENVIRSNKNENG